MSKRMTYVSLAAGLMLPLAAVSAPLSYNHIDGAYVHEDIGPKGDGFLISGQFAFADSWFFTGRYSKANLDGGFPDLERISAGVGYQAPVAEGTSVYGQVTYEHVDLGGSEDGFGVEGGLRYAIAPQFEVNGAIEYGDIDNVVDQKVGFKLGGVYDVTPTIGITAGYESIDDLDEWTVGGRFYFGG